MPHLLGLNSWGSFWSRLHSALQKQCQFALYNQQYVTFQACFPPPISWLLESAESIVTFYNQGNKEDISVIKK